MSKRSSGGILIHLSNGLTTLDTLVFTSQDDIFCIKLKGEVFSLNIDLYICLCCVVPENSSRQSIIESHTIDTCRLR